MPKTHYVTKKGNLEAVCHRRVIASCMFKNDGTAERPVTRDPHKTTCKRCVKWLSNWGYMAKA